MTALRNSVIAAAAAKAAARGASTPDLVDALSAIRGTTVTLGRGVPLSAVRWKDVTEGNLVQLLTEAAVT